MKKQTVLSKYKRWELIEKRGIGKERINCEEIVKLLMRNRGIKNKEDEEEFLNPTDPRNLKLDELGIEKKEMNKGIKRIIRAKEKKEKVIIFGDYDVDGISSSAILWEFLYGAGIDVLPYIPERFSEGYGIKIESILKLKNLYPKLSLIITVDNGIVAHEAVLKARGMGVDMIIVDHHEKGERYPDAYSVIHTTKLCGAAISWVLIRELSKSISVKNDPEIKNLLELAALGTIADQMLQIGVNRSFVKYGLEELNNTKRLGLDALFSVSGIRKGGIGMYEINYVIAPRLNAMGRMENAIDSLRLLCTKSQSRAYDLADLLNRTNQKRQIVVDEMVSKVKKSISNATLKKIIVLSDESYHEGVVGLVAAKLVDEYFRPAIVISKQKGISKGSARSIFGFSIIEAIKSSSHLILGGGGHEMAAGFSLKTKDIADFKKFLERYALKNLPAKLLDKKLKIDMSLNFSDISKDLVEIIKKMEPYGIGNFTPSFLTKDCEVMEIRSVGRSGNHLKLHFKKDGVFLEGIMFNSINSVSDFRTGKKLDIVYNLEENVWNGNISLQLKIKDLKYSK